jgi:hypothetical protein
MKVVEGDEARWPHLVSLKQKGAFERGCESYHMQSQAAVKSAFIRGSVIRYVHIPASAVDTTLLEDATRRGESGSSVAAERGEHDLIILLPHNQKLPRGSGK